MAFLTVPVSWVEPQVRNKNRDSLFGWSTNSLPQEGSITYTYIQNFATAWSRYEPIGCRRKREKAGVLLVNKELNPLSSASDQREISPRNINAL